MLKQKKRLRREEEEEEDTEEKEREVKLPKVTPLRKENEKILEKNESKSYWEVDVDAAIEQAIS